MKRTEILILAVDDLDKGPAELRGSEHLNSTYRITLRGWRNRLKAPLAVVPSSPPAIVKLWPVTTSESSVARWSASRNMSHVSPDRLDR